MTTEERQALREKHRDNGIDGRCETCHYVIEIEEANNFEVCTAPDYPCDVIKVLDATEREAKWQDNARRINSLAKKILNASSLQDFIDLRDELNYIIEEAQ